jgi:hypothetical protein
MGRLLLRSEERRVTLLTALLAFGLGLVVALRLAPQIAAPEIRSRLMALAWPLGLIVIGFLIYELLIRAWLGRLLSSKRLLPRGFPYLNVFIEVSLPRVGLKGSAFCSTQRSNHSSVLRPSPRTARSSVRTPSWQLWGDPRMSAR